MKGRYYSLNEYLKNTFNEKIYKISIDLGLTCPNRDGSLDSRGCIFCLDGSSYFSASSGNIDERIEKAKKLVKEKSGANKFIAYFQSYTNTYASAEYLRSVFYNVISRDEIVGLSIATRPDCLPDEILELISDLNKIKPVWVELGLQTSNEKTGILINRHYSNKQFTKAIELLNKYNIDVVTHIMVGLPNESKTDLENTVNFINKHNIQGLKIHSTYVVENTILADMYKNGRYTPISLEDYINSAIYVLTHINPNIVIHRISGDSPKDLLIAPEWNLHKKLILNGITKLMEEKNLYQGMYYKKMIF